MTKNAHPGGTPPARAVLSHLCAAAREAGPRAALATALRTRSAAYRHVFAELASAGELNYSQIVAGERPQSWDYQWLETLGRTVALQELLENDRATAIMLLEEAALGGRPQDATRELLTQLYLATGRFASAMELITGDGYLETHEWGYLGTDLLNPSTSSPFADPDAWWDRFSRFFTSDGYAAPLLSESSLPALDRLSAPQLRPSSKGPLVSVVMTSFLPEHAPLLTSVRSILDQTWQALEVIVVDDHSPEEFAPILEEVAELDERVSVHRLPRNGGTYLARNFGMRLAKGTFVTGQDADDWSHPERIERQIAPLLEEPDRAGTRVRSVTTNDDLVIHRPGFTATRPNPSTLMFRRELGLRLGGFLPARKAADSEFHARLDAAAPLPVLTIGDSPLTVVRIRTNSLSRSDFRLGWSHPSRRTFVDLYRHWHARARGPEALCSSEETPAIPLPTRMQVEQGAPRDFDIVVVGDFRPRNNLSGALAAEAQELAARGLTVGVLHLEDPTYPTGRRDALAPELLDLFFSGAVTRVVEDDKVTASLVLVRTPATLALPPGEPFGIEARRAIVVADSPPADDTLRWARYDVKDVSRAVEELLGLRPSWTASSMRLHRTLERVLPPSEIEPLVLPLHIDTSRLEMPRSHFRSTKPVVGRAAPDTPEAWPSDADELTDAYPLDLSMDVRMIGTTQVPEHLLGQLEVRRAWTVFQPWEISRAAFLKSIDFYVDVPNRATRDLTEATILEAMAAGCVVVLPPEYKDWFGDAAVYAQRGGFAAVVHRIYDDPSSFREQSRRGVTYVEEQVERYGTTSPVAKLIEERYLAVSAAGGGPRAD